LATSLAITETWATDLSSLSAGEKCHVRARYPLRSTTTVPTLVNLWCGPVPERGLVRGSGCGHADRRRWIDVAASCHRHTRRRGALPRRREPRRSLGARRPGQS